jgi:hypothetical protein
MAHHLPALFDAPAVVLLPRLNRLHMHPAMANRRYLDLLLTDFYLSVQPLDEMMRWLDAYEAGSGAVAAQQQVQEIQVSESTRRRCVIRYLMWHSTYIGGRKFSVSISYNFFFVKHIQPIIVANSVNRNFKISHVLVVDDTQEEHRTQFERRDSLSRKLSMSTTQYSR